MKITNPEGKAWTVKGPAAVALFIFLALVLLSPVFIMGWITMLVLGILHGSYPSVDAWGYWPCFLVALGVRLVMGLFSSSD